LTEPLIIAIDGPSGAGKGTVARALATRLGYQHLDTGAMYRAVAWKAINDGVSLEDEPAVATLADRSKLDVGPHAVRIDDEDVTSAIRTPQIDRAAAAAARLPRVRAVLVQRQRAAGEHGGIVMEGRDIGTVVFPDAEHKFFLVASLEEKVRRRAAQYERRGERVDPESMRKEVELRDRVDMERPVAPLRPAPDAIVIDTDHLDVDQVVDRIVEAVRARA